MPGEFSLIDDLMTSQQFPRLFRAAVRQSGSPEQLTWMKFLFETKKTDAETDAVNLVCLQRVKAMLNERMSYVLIQPDPGDAAVRPVSAADSTAGALAQVL
jgi:hypothetical protein